MAAPPPALTLRGRRWRWGERTLVMGIINATPDSFSGDGVYGRRPAGAAAAGVGGTAERVADPYDAVGSDAAADPDDAVGRAVAQAVAMVEAGADVLDVGGESTRPGGAAVDAAAEIERVVPVVAAIRAVLDVPISIDTSKAAVAAAALAAGADLVNDVWAMTADAAMAGVVAAAGAPIVLMHNRAARATVDGRVGGHYADVVYDDVVAAVAAWLRERVDAALAAGIAAERIILDPGLGFGKTPAQNLALVDRLAEIGALGYPVLVGPSRKSFIGAALDQPPDARLEGTAAAVAVAIARGADIVRVHDVCAMARVARMTDAIVRRAAGLTSST